MHVFKVRVNEIYDEIVVRGDTEFIEAHVEYLQSILCESTTIISDSVMETILFILLSEQELKKDIIQRVVPQVMERIVARNDWSENTLEQVSVLILKSGQKILSVQLLNFCLYLLDNCHVTGKLHLFAFLSNVSEIDPSIETTILATKICPFLQHRNSKVKRSALETISTILKWRPWKSTFPILCLLLGRREDPNVVEMDEFYNPDFTRINYIAKLIFDDNPHFRLYVFKTILSWTVDLEDSSDLESHLLPFVLIGEIDSEIGHEFTTHLNSVRTDIVEYVQKYGRKFIPALKNKIDCDFGNITKSNSQRLMLHVMKYLED